MVVGGDDSKKLSKALKGGVDIVVGTVGKVGDMLKSGALSLAQVKFFILDEADRMVDDAQSLQAIMQHLAPLDPMDGAYSAETSLMGGLSKYPG